MSETGGVVNARPDPSDRTQSERSTLSSSATTLIPPAPRAIMYAYPWDLHDHGPVRAMDELQECGIDAVQLSFSYHIATFFNPRNPRRKVRFGEPGVLEFAPRSSGTTDWPFEPAVSTDVSGARYSAELIETITQHGLSVTAWVVYLYNHLAARMFPDLTIENVFGDRSGAQLCPANPVTREYVTTLTDAVLGHAPLAGLVVESLSYLPYDYGFLNLKSAVTPSQAAALLLSVCFCSHCRARFSAADVDVNDLRHQVAAVLEKEFAALPDGFDRAGTEAWCEQSEQLQRVFAVRTEVASSLQQGVLRTARNIGLRTDTNSAGAHDGRITGMTSAAGEQLRSDYRFEVHPDWTTAQSQRAVTDAAAAAGPAATVYALAQLSNFPDETSFITSLEAVASHGIEHFRLYEYGLLSERHLSWLRNARHLWTVPGSGPTVSATEGME